jgi:cytochrome c
MKKTHQIAFLTCLAGATLSWADIDCDVEAGNRAYDKCNACHPIEPGVHDMGPSLYGVFGRKAGSAEGFTYSVAMEDADFVWDSETMSAFLENPREYIPGTTKPFRSIKKAEQREALECYMRSLSD